MNQAEFDIAVELHLVWLIAEESHGRFADLSGIDLRGLTMKGRNLSHIDFSNSDLSGVDMSESDLSNSDLSGANLSGSNLSDTNLSMADMSNSNLSNANLSGANLHCAILNNANLYEIIIKGTDFNMAELDGTLMESNGNELFRFKKHPANYHGNGLLTVGCFTYHLSEWLEKFREIGKTYKYSEEEIEMYGNFIKQCYEKHNRKE